MFVIPTLSLGGAERVISVLSTAISQSREVVVLKYYDTPNEYEIGENVKVVNLSGGDEKEYRKIGYFQKLKRIRKIIKAEKPHCVIPFLFHVSLSVCVATVFLKTDVFQSIRIDPATSPASKWQRVLRDGMVANSKCTFVQNKAQKKYFKEKHHKKIHVVYNPVYDKIFSCENKGGGDDYIVTAMGRVETQKNFPMLIDAFEKAFDNNASAKLLIYGQGSKFDEIDNYIKSKGLTQKVKMMGRTDDVISAFEKTNVFVLSSDFEGMPNALIEAMAAGVPCISTDCPTGPSDLIENEVNGLLVPVNDTDAMCTALQKMASGDIDTKKMGKAAQNTIKELCSAQQIADRFIKICEDI